MARLNISIPDELKDAMDQIDYNWSGAAQVAFTRVLEIERLKKEGKDMDAGLMRLRDIKNADSEREKAEGFADGQNYALEHADYDELENITRWHESIKANSEQSNAVGLLNNWLEIWANERSIFYPSKSASQSGRSSFSDVGVNYAFGFYEGAASVFTKI